MKRRQRTEILINGSPDVARDLAQTIWQHYEVRQIEEPSNGLVMIKARETAQKHLFYLGEVLVTEAKVQINGRLGLGIVKGDQHELALDLAIIDAAYHAGLKETEQWEPVLLQEEQRILNQRRAHQQKVLRTKVNFETMDVT